VGWVNCIDAKPPRYYEKQSAKAIFLKPRHCEKRRSNLSQSPSLREAKRRGNQHPPLVIARSEATWQSTHPLSLRGAKRRGNPPTPCHCEEQSDVAIHTHPPSLRGAKRRGNPPTPCHCEEQSDVAIHPPLVIARSEATWQSTHPLSLRGAKRRGNPHPPLVIARSEATWQSMFQEVQDLRWIASPSARNDGGAARNDGGWLEMTTHSCHCEEQSDVAIHISDCAGRKMDCFAFGSQ